MDSKTNELDVNIKIGLGDVVEKKEIISNAEYYLDRQDLREIIQKNWPDMLGRLEEIERPGISNHPDELEEWEVRERKKRIATLSEMPALYALQALLYEECFGANANPGQEITHLESYAPTPGGLLSHGYPWGTFDGATLESVSKLDFKGSNAKEAVASLNDYIQKNQLAGIIARTLYSRLDFLSDSSRRFTFRSLQDPKVAPKEESTTWGFRLIQMLKEEKVLVEPVENTELKDVVHKGSKAEWSRAMYWHMLWKKMSNKFIVGDGSNNFRNPNDQAVLDSIGELLFVRTHPEVQILFKYLSPSGYLNQNQN